MGLVGIDTVEAHGDGHLAIPESILGDVGEPEDLTYLDSLVVQERLLLAAELARGNFGAHERAIPALRPRGPRRHEERDRSGKVPLLNRGSKAPTPQSSSILRLS